MFAQYQDQMDRLGFVPSNHSHMQLFPVAARRVFDEKGVELPGYRRIVREDTERTLNVVTDSYSMIDNQVAFDQFEQAIAASTLDTRDLVVATDYANEGARVFRCYMFPNHQEEIKSGVSTALRVIMQNSYDGSMKFTGRAGHYSFVCANLSMAGSEIGNFNIRHSGEIDLAKAVRGLVEAAERHVEAAKRMRMWPQIAITDTQARLTLEALPQASKAQVDRLSHSWLYAKEADTVQSGMNMWTLHAVLTAWATHGDTALGAFPAPNAERISIRMRVEREKQVAALLEGPAWKALEAA